MAKSTAKQDTPAPAAPTTAAELRALLEGAGKPVMPKVNAETITKDTLRLGVVAAFIGSERMQGARSWLKHSFRIPGGGYFALGGDKALNGLLARLKTGDVVGIAYNGLSRPDGADHDEHQWALHLIDKTGQDLATLMRAFDGVYAIIRETTESTRKARMAQRGGATGAPSDFDGYEYNDADAPQ